MQRTVSKMEAMILDTGGEKAVHPGWSVITPAASIFIVIITLYFMHYKE